MRRLLAAVALVGLVGVALACLVLPAGGQTAPPPLSIDNFTPRCGAAGSSTTISMTGRSGARSVSAVVYSPTGAAVTKGSAAPSSFSWTISMTFTPAANGSYEVRVNDSSGGQVSAYLEVPCQAPTLEYSPTCFPAGFNGTVTMTGRHFFPFDQPHTVTYDAGGSEQQQAIRQVSDGRGVVTFTFKVSPSERPHPGRIDQANRQLTASATWSPCPPGTIPTTTTAPSTTTTTAPADTVPDETTTTTSRPTGPGPTVPSSTTTTLPPTVDVPPPTPGATLAITPKIGPTGFVASATGTGFPPGPVELHWTPGIGRTTTIAGPDGRFTVSVLVFPKDQLGARALIATGGTTTAYDGFLVVPSPVEPSSSRDVAQITRTRRFTQR